MLTGNKCTCLQQTYSKLLSVQQTLYSLFFEASCLQKKKKKKPNWPWTGSMVVGLEWSVYLLITARLVLSGEGCLTATLLGSAVWTKWVWVIGAVYIRKYRHTLQTYNAICKSSALQMWGGIVCYWIASHLPTIYVLYMTFIQFTYMLKLSIHPKGGFVLVLCIHLI